MDDKNPRVGGERISGRAGETTRGKLETPDAPATTAATGARTSAASTAPRKAAASGSSASRASRSGATTGAQDPAEDPIEPRTREIRAEIEDTREDLSETVNAIQDRLSPANVAANAKETVKNAARERARDLADSEPVHYVRSNPIPTAMIGIGLAGIAMLAFGDQDRDRYAGRRRGGWERADRGRRDWRSVGPYDRPRYEGTAGYAEYESAAVYTPGLAATHYGTDEAGQYGRGSDYTEYDPSRERPDYGRSGREWAQRGRQMMTRREHQIRRTWDENPLLIGAASAVIGAIVGLMIPETERENELMGETRDAVVEQVQDSVRTKVEEVQHAATQAVNTVKNVATSIGGATESGGTESENTGGTDRNG